MTAWADKFQLRKMAPDTLLALFNFGLAINLWLRPSTRISVTLQAELGIPELLTNVALVLWFLISGIVLVVWRPRNGGYTLTAFGVLAYNIITAVIIGFNPLTPGGGVWVSIMIVLYVLQVNQYAADYRAAEGLTLQQAKRIADLETQLKGKVDAQ